MKNIFLYIFAIFTTFCSCKSQNHTNNITLIDLETMQQKAFNKKIQLIDVRTSLEYKQGFIGNAVNANIYTSDFSKVVSKLDKSKPVYIYCHKGGRSNSAAKKLVQLGFTEIYDFKGGWRAWKNHQKN